jgi:hypothetical protein
MDQRVRNLIRSALGLVESFLNRRGVLSVAFFGLIYYGLYFNADLTLTGEAGSNVLIAQRINEGWRPIKDMFIGYNLMWFYPLAWIFEFTGPHLLASRIYFMTLAGISGLLGFLLVRRVTGIATLAAIAGGLMILMPGAIYRNTVGIVGTLASFALVYGFVVPHRSRVSSILWMGFAGAAMSLCYLIRIEPSLIATVVWAGLVVLYPIGVRGEFLSRLRTLCAGTLLSLCAFAAVHAPFVIHANQRGFGEEFTSQYSQFVNLLRWELLKEIQKNQPDSKEVRSFVVTEKSSGTQVSAPDGASDASPIQAVKPIKSDGADGRRARPPLSDSVQNGGISFFAMSMYFPILSVVTLTLAGGVFFLSGIFVGNPMHRQSGLAILATTGCALALFPQYFFFRPDSVHLAEFMVPFYPALACAAGVAIGLLRGRIWQLAGGALLLAIVGLQVLVSFNSLFGREGSGSIRSARGKTALFEAPGGISMRVRPADLVDWENLRDTLLRHSEPGDWLVTYPYVPVLNILAERPSYQRKLYVDNATESVNFPFLAIAELDEKRPAVVVINNRDINKTEFSRFKNWAAPFYDHIAANYVLKGTYLKEIEVFVRPDRIPKNAP